jgi:hypothetical protein
MTFSLLHFNVNFTNFQLKNPFLMILVTHRHADQMHNAKTEFALAYPNIKVILIEVVVQNVFSILIVQEIKPVFEINV